MSDLQVIVYVDNSAMSVDILQAYYMLPREKQAVICPVDYSILLQQGEEIPSYLNGVEMPVMVPYMENPPVLSGQAAVEKMREYVANAHAKYNPGGRPIARRADTVDRSGNLKGRDPGYMSRVSNPYEADLKAFNPNEMVGMGASVVTDELYFGYMPTIRGEEAPQTGKVTAADIASYTSIRDNSEAVARRKAMGGGR